MRIYEKLVEGPQTARDLCRRFHRLPIKECLSSLQLLETWGLVSVEDGRWGHTETTENPHRVIETSVIDLQ